MVLSNPYRPDPRVEREAEGLVDSGYRVSIICWDRAAELKNHEKRNGVEIRRIQDIQTSYGVGVRQLQYIPRFWQRALKIVSGERPTAVHCHDLDTLWIGRRIQKNTGCRLIYDAHEHYPAMMSLYLPKIIIFLLTLWEERLLRYVDATITASTYLADEFKTKKTDNVITLGNFPRFKEFDLVNINEVLELRNKLKTKSDDLLVGYIAGLSRNRMILPFIKAADQLPEIQFHIWGDGAQRPEVEDAAMQRENVHFHGWLPFSELPVHFHALDVVYYGLQLDYPGAIYNAPNTLTQAMAAGRPIIATDVGDLGRIVRETECGVLIKAATPEAIAKSIQILSDPDERIRLANKGRQAAMTKYNSDYNRERLVELYDRLLVGS